jgi:hypothetical protein
MRSMLADLGICLSQIVGRCGVAAPQSPLKKEIASAVGAMGPSALLGL